MADKSFGVKDINLIGASGTPEIESPNNLNIKAVNVAISTDMSVGGALTVAGDLTVNGTTTTIDTAVTSVDSLSVDGDVKIGTTNNVTFGSRRALTVANGTTGAVLSLYNNTTATSNPRISSNPGGSEINDIGIHAASTNGNIIAYTNNDTERLRITSAGRFGFHTSSPDAEVHIEPVSTNASIILSNDGRTQYFRIQNNETDDAFTINASDTAERLRIDSSGNTTFSGNITLGTDLVVTPGSNAGSFWKNGGNNLYGLYLVGDGIMWRSFDTSKKLIGRVGSTGGVQLTNGSTSWSAYVSESRLKDIISDTDKDQCWNLVRDLELKRYFYKDNDEEFRKGTSYMGPMADWIEKQDPELVIYNDPDEEGPIRTYNQGLLEMKALQALSTALTRIETLEAKVAALEG